MATAGPPPSPPPAALEAYFERTSYAAGGVARLRISGHARRLAIVHVGAPPGLLGSDPRVHGRVVARGPARRRVRIGRWRPGVYVARVTARRRVAYAPFVLRGGRSRVAIVVPTNTWQAYNFRDANGDGVGDTWYAGHGQHSVDRTRPFARPGLPLYFRQAAVPFLRWVERHGLRPAFLSDDDVSARALRRHRLLVFAGHEEYVTAPVLAAVRAFAERGGNLMFLSANNFFAHVARTGDRLVRVGRWRDAGQPESAWIGVQYADWWHRRWPDQPYRARRAAWLFRGTGIRPGAAFGSYGKEVDQRTAFSPRGTRVLAEARDIFGRGVSAQMTIRRTPGGGQIFAAGALDFVNRAMRPVETRLLENLWARLAP